MRECKAEVARDVARFLGEACERATKANGAAFPTDRFGWEADIRSNRRNACARCGHWC